MRKVFVVCIEFADGPGQHGGEFANGATKADQIVECIRQDVEIAAKQADPGYDEVSWSASVSEAAEI